jgi:hypothetical protein
MKEIIEIAHITFFILYLFVNISDFEKTDEKENSPPSLSLNACAMIYEMQE